VNISAKIYEATKVMIKSHNEKLLFTKHY